MISDHVRVRNSTSARTSSGAALAAAVRTMKPPPEAALGFVDQMAQARAFFGGSDFARDAGVIERGHINQKAAGQRDVAGDARAFLAQRFLGDLHDDFLALLEHVRDQLRCARLLRAAVTVPAAVAVLAGGGPSVVAPAAAIAAATTTRDSACASGNRRARAPERTRLRRLRCGPSAEIAPPFSAHGRDGIGALRFRRAPVPRERPCRLSSAACFILLGFAFFFGIVRVFFDFVLADLVALVFIGVVGRRDFFLQRRLSGGSVAAANTRFCASRQRRHPAHRQCARRSAARFFFRLIHVRVIFVVAASSALSCRSRLPRRLLRRMDCWARHAIRIRAHAFHFIPVARARKFRSFWAPARSHARWRRTESSSCPGGISGEAARTNASGTGALRLRLRMQHRLALPLGKRFAGQRFQTADAARGILHYAAGNSRGLE